MSLLPLVLFFGAMPTTALTAPSAAVHDTIPGTAWTTADWEIFQASIRHAVAARIDTLPVGAAIALVGLRFVGAPYTPGTLEQPGPEQLVVNLREFDCVTFVEHVLALVHVARHDGVALLDDAPRARMRYEAVLRELRYRGGRIDGYASRLHYFSQWLAEHASRGRLHVLGDEIGADTDARPVQFMSTHPAAYPKLAGRPVLEEIRRGERRIGPRRVVPKAEMRRVEPLLRDGDLLAMTSAVEGLDVAHVGFAVLVGGRPHLLNAPLVGRSVELSPLPLMEHLAARTRQTGVIVARMDERW